MKMMKISDEDDCNSKLSNSTYLIPSTYCHYFHAPLTPSQDLTFPWKPFASLTKFRILIYYSCPSSPISLEIIPSYSAIKIESITLLLHSGRSNKLTTLRTHTHRYRHMNKMFDSWPSNLDGEMLPLRFGWWLK